MFYECASVINGLIRLIVILVFKRNYGYMDFNT